MSACVLPFTPTCLFELYKEGEGGERLTDRHTIVLVVQADSHVGILRFSSKARDFTPGHLFPVSGGDQTTAFRPRRAWVSLGRVWRGLVLLCVRDESSRVDNADVAIDTEVKAVEKEMWMLK